jgi:putative ABC transport system ATP-binding protein
MAKDTIILTSEIAKVYQMGDIKVAALNGVSIKIQQGEFVAIMGPSGSGKSTMMNILVFQSYNLLARTTALENVSIPLLYDRENQNTDEENEEIARQMLETVGLGDRIKHMPHELSGGQQQRVAIARSLVNDPFLLLADEPTGNLDSKSGLEIMDILVDLHQRGRTIVMVTHETEIAEYAQRTISFLDGKINIDKLNGRKSKQKRKKETK